MNKIGLTNFASRYWNPDVPGTTLIRGRLVKDDR